MRISTISVLAALLLAAEGTAASAEGPYVGGQVGFGAGGGEDEDFNVDLELDAGPFLDVFVGASIGRVRVEGEYAYRENDMDNWGGLPIPGEMSSHALMGNFYYDFGDGSGITPYLGAGLGIAEVTLDSTFYVTDDSDTTFAFQIMGGVAFPVSGTLLMTLDLRGLGAAPHFVDEFGNSFEQRYNVWTLAVGLRSSF